jgi:hypothetical protein
MQTNDYYEKTCLTLKISLWENVSLYKYLLRSLNWLQYIFFTK